MGCYHLQELDSKKHPAFGNHIWLEHPHGKIGGANGKIMCFPWHHGGFSMATFDDQRGITCCALLRRCSALGLPKGSKGCKGFGLFGPSTPCKDRSHLTCLQDKKPQITESFTWFVHCIAVAFENNFFLALMSMGACAASVASASRIDGWKWSVFGWLWDGENAMRCVNKTADLTTGTSVTPSLRFFFSWCFFHHLAGDKCHEKWWSHPHEAIGWVQTSMKRSWPPWPLWPLGSTMPGQRICGGDWNRAPGVKSRRGADLQEAVTVYAGPRIMCIYILIINISNLSHTHTHIYIYIKFITRTYIYIYNIYIYVCVYICICSEMCCVKDVYLKNIYRLNIYNYTHSRFTPIHVPLTLLGWWKGREAASTNFLPLWVYKR